MGNGQKEVLNSLQFKKWNYYKNSNIRIFLVTNQNINLCIAGAEKMEEEIELEVLDDVGGSGGLGTSSAITAIGRVY